MISPPTTLLVPQRSTDVPGGKPKTAGGADAFADILAAASVALFPIERATPVGGPAIVSVTDLALAEVAPIPPELASAALTDPTLLAKQSGESSFRPTARIFNQDGFFDSSSVTDIESDVSTRQVAIPVAGEPVGVSGLVLDPKTPIPGPIVASTPNLPPSAVTREASLTELPRFSHAALPANMGFERLRVVSAAESVADGVEELPALGINSRSTKAATNAVQVALHELEQGLQVSVRLDALDDSERQQLHDEIMGMLARHGLTPSEVRISAPAAAKRSQGRLR